MQDRCKWRPDQPLGAHKMQNISWLAEEVSASQAFCSMQLNTYVWILFRSQNATFCSPLGWVRSTRRKQQSAYPTFICRNAVAMYLFLPLYRDATLLTYFSPSNRGIPVLDMIISWTIKSGDDIKILFFLSDSSSSSSSSSLCSFLLPFLILSIVFRLPQLPVLFLFLGILSCFSVSSLSRIHLPLAFPRQLI